MSYLDIQCFAWTFNRQLTEMLPLLQFKMLTIQVRTLQKIHPQFQSLLEYEAPKRLLKTCLNGWMPQLPPYNWGRFGASMIHHQPQVPNQNFPKKTGAKVPAILPTFPKIQNEFPKTTGASFWRVDCNWNPTMVSCSASPGRGKS